MINENFSFCGRLVPVPQPFVLKTQSEFVPSVAVRVLRPKAKAVGRPSLVPSRSGSSSSVLRRFRYGQRTEERNAGLSIRIDKGTPRDKGEGLLFKRRSVFMTAYSESYRIVPESRAKLDFTLTRNKMEIFSDVRPEGYCLKKIRLCERGGDPVPGRRAARKRQKATGSFAPRASLSVGHVTSIA